LKKYLGIGPIPLVEGSSYGTGDISQVLLHCSMNIREPAKKISLANFSFRISLSARAMFVRLKKESQNGLEDPKDR
jgi:hypothetical protein